jgi:hypothetical protein
MLQNSYPSGCLMRSSPCLDCALEYTARWLDDELGDQRHEFVDGTSVDWQQLPDVAGFSIVGRGGGYMHARN